MSLDWPLVTLLLGIMGAAVAAYAIARRDIDRKTQLEVASTAARVLELASGLADVRTGLKRVEGALNMDRPVKGVALPAMMR